MKTNFLICVIMLLGVNFLQAQTYKIGDRHPDGGIVFSVDGSGTKGFIVSSEDIGRFTFAEAGKGITKRLGAGWAMPNKAQLNEIYVNLHKKGIGNFENQKYRTGQPSGYPMYPWAQNFANGKQEGDGLNNKTLCRGVKAFSSVIEKKSRYKIGDMHPCGGIVFQVDATGKKGLIAAPTDAGKFAFAEAGRMITQKMGAGWVMPNKVQLNEMYVNLHKKGLGNFQNAMYRTGQASSYAHYPWAQNFANGRQEGNGLNNKTLCRPIKAFPCTVTKVVKEEIAPKVKEAVKPKVSNTLTAGQNLKTGQKIQSANGKYYLIMQTDGNLCIYMTQDNRFIWCSMAHGFSGATLKMQSDGNLVVYSGSNAPKWSSQTHPAFNRKFANRSNKPVKLVLEDNGTLQLYNSRGQVMWKNK